MSAQLWRAAPVVRWIGGFFAAWSCLFALDVLRIGDRVTSKQWQYLMSVPGGRVTWFVIFFVAGITLACGVLTKRYHVAAAGWLTMGIASLGIAVFYYFARFFDQGLLTLGHWIWAIGAATMLFGFAVNWTDKRW